MLNQIPKYRPYIQIFIGLSSGDFQSSEQMLCFKGEYWDKAKLLKVLPRTDNSCQEKPRCSRYKSFHFV